MSGGYLDRLFGLAGKRAVVTGGTSGIGRAASLALAQAGADVIVGGRSAERANEAVEAIVAAGGSASSVLGELGSRASAEAFAERVLQRGPVDILVNSAGVFEREPGETTSAEMWDRALQVNVTATFQLCQAFGRGMLERGSGKIINIASTDGIVGVPEQAAYCASKGAVVQLTRTLAVEWIRRGVHVNAIGPCDFDTPLIADALADPSYESWIHDAIPAGRIGRPEDIAGAIVYLASSASDLVVGHHLMVDGGRTAI